MTELELPVLQVMPELKEILNRRTSALLIAEPGAGKTTQTPLAFLHESWLDGQKIVMLEPRRLAARSAAAYMASQLGEKVGQTVGYRVRMDSKTSASTRIEVVTEGILTRMLQRDPELGGVGMIIFDEFHERNIHGDLGLALALESQSVLREDLRLLIMSATLEAEPVAALLGGAPVVHCAGRQYPVETVYAPPAAGTPLHQAVAAVVSRALSVHDGDMLVFLPGAREIGQVRRELEQRGLPAGCVIRPLHGQLPQQEQDEAVAPDRQGRRKIILSTSIAETSLTIQGVTIVVDAGLMRTQMFSPRTGMSGLTTVKVSKASADQRRGRAGRTMRGIAYRLWSREEQDFLPERSTPEILLTDLAPLALELAAWGVKDPLSLQWLDPPPAAAYGQAVELLKRLGALDSGGGITGLGKKMSAAGMHPRLSRMVLLGAAQGHGLLAAILAALLQERDLFQGQSMDRDVDIRKRAEAVAAWMRGGRGTLSGLADEGRIRRIEQEIRGIRASMDLDADAVINEEYAGPLLSLAYPDRIGQNRGNGRFLLTSGRGVEIGQVQLLSRAPYIVAASVDDVKGAEARVLLAAPLPEAELFALHQDGIIREGAIAWDRQIQGVKARQVTRLGAVILRESPDPAPPSEAVTEALLDGIAVEGLDILPWNKSSTQLRQRLQFMHLMHADWPDFSGETLSGTLREWLQPYLHGMKKKSDLQRLHMSAVLEQSLTWEQRKQLDEEAPTHITVPSGSRIPVDYSDPAKPVLAVKLQEMFGWHETPRIGKGKTPLTLHLLSPAQRPVQVTSDLASFWKQGYFDVKKDLKGRYPKHYWPDDPLEAVPTRRTRPQ
ncbi:ATP-dependent helicase HrpB [Paenibacillus sp. SSG-1]|uniref:ATP-dependent helicase HrpB n=1 Tax=Paenibacillus sp. SSG-1 TaxID=1443669 RepID=UPI000B7DB259|nr:ATP-dependent helicase HrpB [Paenibacillus sp. SSG-1]OXL82916.1 ATP-dependent helicase HrpB [Paenibacillus sp. SSG-1]